jgi:hypothetical protein
VPAAAANSATAPAKPAGKWGRLFLYGALLVLVLTVGTESWYILMHDEAIVSENQKKPPVVVPSSPAEPAATTKPIDVATAAAPAQDAITTYLQSLNLAVSTGADPRIFANGAVFHLGQVVAPQFGLRWTSVNDQSRVLEFTDQSGHRYLKKF